MSRRQRGTMVLGLAAGLALAAIAVTVRPGWAGAPAARPGVSEPRPVPAADNAACLGCHSVAGMQTKLASGEILPLTIDPQTFQQSVHGQKDMACVQCHTNISGFPHPALTAPDRRAFTLQMYRSCIQCHEDKYKATLDSVHQKALAAGNTQAAVCTDCHGAHDTTPPDQPRSRIPQTCDRCHSTIYNLYRESVHGAALMGEGNPDVPSCIDCHGVHNVQGPSTSPFRLFSPQICARCHTDVKLMAKYGISTQVMDTYVADFHGTTVVIFQAVAPGQVTNKPVCIDCHGVHDIRRTDDPDSTVIKQNLLATCRKCHPDATTNFPSAWLSHYPPSPQHSPVVYYVNLFYRILIPGLLGGMAVFVLADAGRRLVNRRKERRHG